MEDLKRNNRRVTFGMYEDAESTPEERETNFKKGVAALTSDLQSRLLYAVRHSKVRSFSKSRTLEDFLQRGDEDHLPELTFVHYTDLIAWLTQFGYIDRLTFAERPAFEEYERNELDLLEHLEEDGKVRRHLRGKRVQSPLRTLASPASEEDAHLQIQERLAAALLSIQRLKLENDSLYAQIDQIRFASECKVETILRQAYCGFMSDGQGEHKRQRHRRNTDVSNCAQENATEYWHCRRTAGASGRRTYRKGAGRICIVGRGQA